MSLTILGGAALQWPLGYWSDREDRRRVIALISFVTAGVTAIATFAAHPGTSLMLAMMVFGGGAFSLYSISVAHLIDFVPQHAILEASSGLLLVYGVGAAIGPAAAGLLMNGAGASALLMFFAGPTALLGVFALYRIQRYDRVARHPQPFVPRVRAGAGPVESPVDTDIDPDTDRRGPAPP